MKKPRRAGLFEKYAKADANDLAGQFSEARENRYIERLERAARLITPG